MLPIEYPPGMAHNRNSNVYLIHELISKSDYGGPKKIKQYG